MITTLFNKKKVIIMEKINIPLKRLLLILVKKRTILKFNIW